MADVLIYWRGDLREVFPELGGRGKIAWHSRSTVVGELLPGDSVWFVTSGAVLGRVPERSGFLVGIGKVIGVLADAGDDPGPRANEERYRILLDPSESVTFDDPVPVDHVLRPEGRDRSLPIGRFVSVPRRLNSRMVRRLRAAAGPELALRWLIGTRR